MRKLAAGFVMLFVVSSPAMGEACRQALALGLDVSGSVDAREYRQQLSGLSAALTQPQVQDAFLALPEAPVRLAVFEWSGPSDQHLLAGWQTIRSPADLKHLATTLAQTQRTPADLSTGLGSSIVFGASLLAQNPDCWQHTLDISGDGISNAGPRPQDVRELPLVDPITINALVIASANSPQQENNAGLVTYFEELVTQGLFSFVEQADGFENYADAMTNKLLRELSGMVLSWQNPKGMQKRPAAKTSGHFASNP